MCDLLPTLEIWASFWNESGFYNVWDILVWLQTFCFVGGNVVKIRLNPLWLFTYNRSRGPVWSEQHTPHMSPLILEVTGLIPVYRDSQVRWTEDTCR